MATGFDIEVRDRIKRTIARELQRIASTSVKTAAGITAVGTASAKAAPALTSLGTASTRTATSADRLAIAQTKANAAMITANAAASAAATSAARFAALQNRQNVAVLRSHRGFLGIIRDFRAIAGIAAIIGASRGFVSSIDTFTELQNKLKNVTEGQEQLADVTKRVADVANRARVPIGDVGKAFQRFDIAVKSLGGSQEESLRITETVSKLLTLQGSTANEASSALLQLSQAFNKGKLDGDEFRSVMELMPRAALEIQRTLGITRAELFEFAEEGLISTNVLRVAFNNLAEGVDRDFRNTTRTLGQNLTVLGNRFVIFFGRLERQTGIIARLGEALVAVGNNLDVIAKAAGAVAVAFGVIFAPRIVASVIALGGALNPITVGILAIVGLLVFFRDEIKLTEDGLVTLADGFNTLVANFKKGTDIIISSTDGFRVSMGQLNDIPIIGEFVRPFRDLTNFVLGSISAIRVLITAMGDIGNLEPIDIGLFLVEGAFNKLVDLARVFSETIVNQFRRLINVIILVTAAVVGIFTASAENAKLIVKNLLPIGSDFKGFFDPIKIETLEGVKDLKAKMSEEFNRDFFTEMFAPLGAAIRQTSTDRILESGTFSERIGLGLRQVNLSLTELRNNLTPIKDEFSIIERVIFNVANRLAVFGTLANELPPIFARMGQAALEGIGNITTVATTVGVSVSNTFEQLARNIETTLGGISPALDAIVSTFVSKGQSLLNSMTFAFISVSKESLDTFIRLAKDIETALNSISPTFAALLSSVARVASTMRSAFNAAAGGGGTGAPTTITPIVRDADKATTAVNNLGGSVGNLGNQFGLLEGTVASVFSNLGRAIEDFARTGKFDFKKFITSILSDMLRLLTNQLTRQFLQVLGGGSQGGLGGGGGGGGLLGGLFGGGGGLFGGLFGFAHGGFTGNKSDREIAGLVHGNEFVVNSGATRGNRAALESLNRTGQLSGGGGGPNIAVGMNVTVINQSSAKIQVERLSETDVRIIAKDEADRSVISKAGSVVAQEMSNSNSLVSKSMIKNIKTERRRTG